MPSTSAFLSDASQDHASPFRKDGVTPTPHQPLLAVEQIRRMRGGSQAHLMRCADGNYYVVKLQNNPQGSKILANEFLCGLLAESLDLPVAPGKLLLVTEELIRYTKDLAFEMPRAKIPCTPGLSFGSLYQGDPRCAATTLSDLPDHEFSQVRNIHEFCGMLVFDLWTCNTDGRQVLYSREANGCKYRAVMIDQGLCFNGSDWTFPDSPLRGRYWRTNVYLQVRGMESFDPWLSQLESEMDEVAIFDRAARIPPEWYQADTDSLSCLVTRLARRRLRIRELIWSARKCLPALFKNWI